MGQWYETGTDGVDREKVERERRRNMPWRFFLKVGQTSRVVFLDDFTKVREVVLPSSGETVKQPTTPVCIHEHNLTIDGDWKNWLTCTRRSDPPCPICSASYYSYYIGMYSVLAEWSDQDGGTRWTKKLFGAKVDAIERIRMKQAQYRKDGRIPDGQFQHCMFHVSRSSERSVVTGDDLEFIKKLSPSEVADLLPRPQQGQEPISIEPYDYLKILAPKPRAEIEKLLRSGRVQPPRSRKSPVGDKPDIFATKSTVSSPEGSTDEEAGAASSNPADDIPF